MSTEDNQQGPPSGIHTKELTRCRSKFRPGTGISASETQAKITSKLEKLSRYFERLTEIEVTIDLEHRDNPDVDLRVSAEHKHDFVAADRAGELLASIDEVVDKMEQQFRKYKQKVQDRHRSTGHRPPEAADELAP